MQNEPVALVTGANKGIGLQIAKDLASHGFIVLVGSRSLPNGEEAAKGVGADARALQLDVTDPASIAAAAERVRTEFGRLDVLVNNAGISHAGEPGRPLTEIIAASAPSVASLDEVRESTVTVEASKFYSDSRGSERPAPFNQTVDIGLFAAHPGQNGFAREDGVSIQRMPIRSGEQQVRLVTRRRPVYAGIDPYIGFIDRNSTDNITEVTGVRASRAMFDW